MAVRGRPTSSAPQDLVEKVADEAGLQIPGEGDERDNRIEGIAPLSGTAVGVVVGAVGGMVHRAFTSRGRSVPAVVETVLLGAAAMALSDVPLHLLGISDARTWTTKDWVSDVVPHLVFGAVTTAAIRASTS